MRKSRTSVKGEYNFGTSISSPAIRNFQELLNSRNCQLESANKTLTGKEHKMEFVKTIRGIDFINDSASSNLNGIYMALANTDKKVTWITSFTEWNKLNSDFMALIVEKVDHVVFYNHTNPKAEVVLNAMNISTDSTNDLETAVRTAFYATKLNGSVLFSPGVPATEPYSDYAERGDYFKLAVAQL